MLRQVRCNHWRPCTHAHTYTCTHKCTYTYTCTSRTHLDTFSGCQLIAPSDMMDNRVGAIKSTLDQHGYGEKVGTASPSLPHYHSSSRLPFYQPPCKLREMNGLCSSGCCHELQCQVCIHVLWTLQVCTHLVGFKVLVLCYHISMCSASHCV